MDVSDDLGEWDIVSTTSLESEETKIEAEEKDAPEDPTAKDLENEEAEAPEDISEDNNEIHHGSENREEEVINGSGAEDINGSSVENIINESGVEDIINGSGVEDIINGSGVEDIINGSGVEDVEPEYPPPYASSCSSGSDIDVIDESSLEDNQSHESLNPSLDISMGSSVLGQAFNPPTYSPEVGADPIVPRREPRAEPYQSPLMQCTTFVVCFFMVFLLYSSEPKRARNSYMEMETRITELEAENKELKNLMITIVDEGKSSLTLEEQIKALKDENYKLSVFMQDLIEQLEHQTITFKKESEIQGEVAHQNEIDKLKEQVNILRIDNDELQKQLVRMRYGAYSPRPTDPKASDENEKEESMAETNEHENATEILSEEIKELKDKLFSEVEKLKEWKRSVHVLIKELENRPSGYGSTKSSKPKGEKNQRKNRYEKIFKDINDHFIEAVNSIPQFNLSDLVNKYMGVDKKKVKSVFDSVGHFFKKAQEKTKDIFDENMKSDMWNFIGSFRKQWHVLRKSYFEYSKKLQQGHNPFKEQASSFNGKNSKETYHQTESYGRIPKEEKVTSDIPSSNILHDYRNEAQDQQESHRKKNERRGEATLSRNSWVFERAAHRSEIRENQEEEDVNWFLRNKKKTEIPDYFNMDENDQEPDSYEQKDMFSMD